jgi:hypothetical protein
MESVALAGKRGNPDLAVESTELEYTGVFKLACGDEDDEGYKR